MWMKIFEHLSAVLCPTHNGTFIQDLHLMRNWKEGEQQAAITTANSPRATLSLVCKKFRDILEEMGDRVTTIGRGEDVRMLGFQNLENTKSLFLYTREGRTPPRRLQDVEFQALRLLYVEDLHAFDLCDIFDKSPRLQALSIGIPYSTCYLYNTLSHAVATRLTHFALTMKAGMWLEPISLPYLRFLCLRFVHWNDYASTSKTGRDEIARWVFPRLSSLALCGAMDERWFRVLIPFLQNHREAIVRLANELSLYRPGLEYKAVVASYFSALNLYGGDINEVLALQNHTDALQGGNSQPLTMLINSHSLRTLSKRVDNEDLAIIQSNELPGIRLPGTGYIVTRVMVNWPWEQTELHLRTGAAQEYELAFQWLHSYSVQIVDSNRIDLEDFTGFRPRSEGGYGLVTENLTTISDTATPVTSPHHVSSTISGTQHDIGRSLYNLWSTLSVSVVAVVERARNLLETWRSFLSRLCYSHSYF